VIIPVILSGGTGKRLWPLSTPEHPKQFHRFLEGRSTFQHALERCKGAPFDCAPIIVGSNQHLSLMKEDMASTRVKGDVLLEPIGRDTCAAIVVASLQALQREDDPILFVSPSDHLIEDNAALRVAINTGWQLARDGYLVTFGSKPCKPSIQFGYLKAGDPINGKPDSTGFKLDHFHEKPHEKQAVDLVEAGYLWNSGMFLFRAKTFLDEVRIHQPDVYVGAEGSFLARQKSGSTIILDREALEFCPSISVDHGLFEKTDRAAVVAIDFEWKDIGSWQAVQALAGHELDMDAVLKVRSAGNLEQRPWGSFERLSLGQSHQVKEICVAAGQILSLQKHHHRAEHWVLVSGEGEVELNDEKKAIKQNEHVFIPKNSVHRLANTGTEPLILIEVQIGDYFGEDDIERLDDIYDRQIES